MVESTAAHTLIPVQRLGPTFTTKAARAAGVRYADLYAARDAGELMELSRGVFRRTDAPAATWPDLLAVAYRARQAVFCLMTAAQVHDLTDQLPLSVQFAVPRGTWPPTIQYPPTEVFSWDPERLRIGVTTVEAAPGERISITSAERTVVDLMRLRVRMGESEVHRVLHRYLARPDAKPAVLLDMARELGVLGPMRSALDILTAS